MKQFFLKTYAFWLITRITFMAVAIIDLPRTFSKAVNELDILIDIAAIAYIGLMAYNTVIEFKSQTRQQITKHITGGISILIAILIYLLVMSNGTYNIFLAAAFVIWIAFLGIFDLSVMNRREGDEPEIMP